MSSAARGGMAVRQYLSCRPLWGVGSSTRPSWASNVQHCIAESPTRVPGQSAEAPPAAVAAPVRVPQVAEATAMSARTQLRHDGGAAALR